MTVVPWGFRSARRPVAAAATDRVVTPVAELFYALQGQLTRNERIWEEYRLEYFEEEGFESARSVRSVALTSGRATRAG